MYGYISEVEIPQNGADTTYHHTSFVHAFQVSHPYTIAFTAWTVGYNYYGAILSNIYPLININNDVVCVYDPHNIFWK